MIGSDEMSSTSMDISESFRPEDLSKTDFFNFVTAPDMGIGIGVGVGVGVHGHGHHGHDRPPGSNDGGGSVGPGDADPALQGYDQFWNSDKDHHSRLESTIFEDLDRYCWQQQHHQQHQLHQQTSHPATHQSALSPTGTAAAVGCHQQLGTSSLATNAATSISSNSSLSQPGSAGTSSSLENTDGQIYTITVLNGTEPWLKREPESQLPGALDLDSLLGNFPGYIKSEYPYDDSGFSTDGTKDTDTALSTIQQHQQQQQQLQAQHQQSIHNVVTQSSNLPSLVTTMSGTPVASTAVSVAAASPAGNSPVQMGQLFPNNNNDWHMADNNAEQNSAESLLRSALQGKGYSKGLHLQYGITLLPSSSPSVKDEELRRVLFPPEADSLGFADSTLSSQIFDDNQTVPAHSHSIVTQHSPSLSNSGPQAGNSSHNNTATALNTTTTTSSAAGIIVDDMFLSLESAFNDDFEKIKRIANEVQQFCSAGGAADYPEVIMEISGQQPPSSLQQLHSPSPSVPALTTCPARDTHQSPQQPPSRIKSELSNSGAGMSSVTKTSSAKKYKRSSSHNNNSNNSKSNNNNNNNPSVMNHNSNNNNSTNISSSSNSGNNNNATSTSTCSNHSNSSSSPTHCNGQRKERSLHYCSICSKGFKDKYSVNVHIRTHTGEKPFSCSLCGKSFRQKAHLAKHYQTHLAQKNNGSIVKGSSSKHHRITSTSTGSLGAVGEGRGEGGEAGNGATAQVRGGMISSPHSNGPLPSLPSANGLLANR